MIPTALINDRHPEVRARRQVYAACASLAACEPRRMNGRCLAAIYGPSPTDLGFTRDRVLGRLRVTVIVSHSRLPLPRLPDREAPAAHALPPAIAASVSPRRVPCAATGNSAGPAPLAAGLQRRAQLGLRQQHVAGSVVGRRAIALPADIAGVDLRGAYTGSIARLPR